MTRHLKVFVSSSHGDNKWLRAAVAGIERVPGFTVSWVNKSLSTEGQAMDEIAEALLTADIFALIDDGMSTWQGKRELETQLALDLKLPMIVLYSQALTGWPDITPFIKDSAEIVQFRSEDELQSGLAAGLNKLAEKYFERRRDDFTITFDPELSEHQVRTVFEGLANYYRACGGLGFSVEFEYEEAGVRELIHV